MHERLELPSHELIALREQNAMLKNALLNERDASRASGIEMEEQLKAVTEQRDRLVMALERCLNNSWDGPMPDYARQSATTALQSLTTNEQ